MLSFRYGKSKGETDCSALIAVIDSLNNVPPRVTTDTFINRPDPEIKWRTEYLPAPEVPKKRPYLFEDSIVNDHVAIYVRDSVQGRLFWRDFGYKLFVPLKTTIRDSVFIDVPVLVDRPVYKTTHGVYMGASVGGGSQFAYSFDAAYVFDKHQVGVQYLRFGGTNNWMVGYRYLIYQRK